MKRLPPSAKLLSVAAAVAVALSFGKALAGPDDGIPGALDQVNKTLSSLIATVANLTSKITELTSKITELTTVVGKPAAGPTMIATGVLFSADMAICTVTNVGKTPTTVTLTIRNSENAIRNGPLVQTLEPGFAQDLRFSRFKNDSVWCQAESPQAGQLRANLAIYEGEATPTLLAAVAAQ